MERPKIRITRLIVYGSIFTFISIYIITLAIWKWTADESWLKGIAPAKELIDKNDRPHRILPTVPTGRPTELYLENSILEVDYYLALDTKKNYMNFENATITDLMTWRPSDLYYRNAWLARVHDFRRELSKEGLNNVDYNISLENALFRQEPVFSSAQFPYKKYIQRRKTDVSFDDVILEEKPSIDRFRNCLSDPINCGEINAPLVVNITIILPLNAVYYNSTWPTLESLRQLVVFPREVIIVISNLEDVENKLHIFSLINIVNEVYKPSLPDAVSFKVFISHGRRYAGNSRWFGVNQTDVGSISMVYDADDYMHPQVLQVMWEVFTRRPELDYALFKFQKGYVEGEYHGDSYYHKIFEFLEKHHYSSSEIDRVAEYSDDAYKQIRQSLPDYDEKWYLGNTDVEHNWHDDPTMWWDYWCGNGWQVMRRYVMDMVQPPTKAITAEDVIFSFRVVSAGLNYKCLDVVLGLYIKCNSIKGRIKSLPLWTISD